MLNSPSLKFIYSEKATQFCEIFTLLLTGTTQDKSKVKISPNFVAFSEYMIFTLFMLTYWVGGSKKVQKCVELIYGWPLRVPKSSPMACMRGAEPNCFRAVSCFTLEPFFFLFASFRYQFPIQKPARAFFQFSCDCPINI